MTIVSIYVALCAILALVSLGYFLIDFSSVYWPSFTGRLIKLSLVTIPNNHVTGKPVFQLNAEYEYLYHGKKYQSTRVVLSNRCRSTELFKIERLKQAVEKEGASTVTVKVCPLFPELSVLLPRKSENALLVFLFFYAVGSGGLTLFFSELISST